MRRYWGRPSPSITAGIRPIRCHSGSKAQSDCRKCRYGPELPARRGCSSAYIAALVCRCAGNRSSPGSRREGDECLRPATAFATLLAVRVDVDAPASHRRAPLTLRVEQLQAIVRHHVERDEERVAPAWTSGEGGRAVHACLSGFECKLTVSRLAGMPSIVGSCPEPSPESPSLHRLSVRIAIFARTTAMASGTACARRDALHASPGRTAGLRKTPRLRWRWVCLSLPPRK